MRCECRKDELWVISSSPFLEVPTMQGLFDRTQLPWVAVVRSLWHGPNPDGRHASSRAAHTPHSYAGALVEPFWLLHC